MANQQLGFDVVGRSNASEVMGKAGKEADKLANKLKGAFDIKGALTGAFIGAFGAAALLDKSIQLITESYKSMATTADLAGKAGISASEFDKLAFAAEDAGVSTQVLSKSIRELRFMMKDALTDTAKMEYLTKGLGYTEEEVRSGKIKNIELFQRIAFAVKEATTDQEKLAITTKFFSDKMANDMLPILEEMGKNPDMFKGLVVATDEAYAAADKMDTKFSKLWHNIKTGIASVTMDFLEHAEKQKNIYGSVQTYILEKSPFGKIAKYFGFSLSELDPMNKLAEEVGLQNPIADQPATAPIETTKAQKEGAKFLAEDIKKNAKDDNTIANSLGASMGNGPTSGVIGVGNNATFGILEEQLITLKGIKDGIDRLAPSQAVQTDFTKQEQYTD
jgi:hypothetical protein